MNKIKIRFQKSSIPLKSLKSSKIYLLIFCFSIAVIIYESLNFTPKAHLIVVDNPEILYESEHLTVYFGRVPSRFMRKIVCRLRLSEVSRQ